MKKGIYILGFLAYLFLCGFTEEGKIVYDSPTPDDIIVVNLALGRMTVLSFPEELVIVTIGDLELFAVERTKKEVYLKPILDKGETNLFCASDKKRYNFHLVIGPVEAANYVVNVDSITEEQNKGKKLSLQEMLYYCRAYDQLSKMGVITDRVLVKSPRQALYEKDNIQIEVNSIFFHQKPHWLAVAAQITNKGQGNIRLWERNSNLYINGKKVKPSYVVFDLTELGPDSKTWAYYILENTNISKENNFVPSVEVGNNEVILLQ